MSDFKVYCCNPLILNTHGVIVWLQLCTPSGLAWLGQLNLIFVWIFILLRLCAVIQLQAFLSLYLFIKALWYIYVHHGAIFLNWIVNVTATHTVNNLLECNLYMCYSYNWICLLGLAFFPSPAGETDWEELLPSQVSPGSVQSLHQSLWLPFAEADLWCQ